MLSSFESANSPALSKEDWRRSTLSEEVDDQLFRIFLAYDVLTSAVEVGGTEQNRCFFPEWATSSI